MSKYLRRGSLLLLIAFLLVSCSKQADPSSILDTTPEVSPTPAAVMPDVFLGNDLPKDLVDSAKLPQGWNVVNDPSKADVVLQPGQEAPISRWVYVLVAPFPTIPDEVKFADLENVWKNGANADFPTTGLSVDPQTMKVLTESMGIPDTTFIKEIPSSEILDNAWNTNTWAIIPFEDLVPRWKVLLVDGQSPIRKGFDPTAYPLTVQFSLVSKTDNGKKSVDALGQVEKQAILVNSNFDPGKMTILTMTGVTALVRGTAAMMELKGVTYPAIDIRDILRNADLTHISNEVPFAVNCPPPSPDTNLQFCSKDKYIDLLKDVGTDIVEMSGDHFADWGAEAMLHTLDLYQQLGWKTYGGGTNLEEAKKPLLIENNGNKLAFLGCNAKEPGYATAAIDNPGAWHCDWDYMSKTVRELRDQGYLPIVTFQHLEFYSYTPKAQLVTDFELMADSGAVIVSGSQAHQPHAMEFREDAFLHYGLGNLFFDQVYEGEPERQAFIDRHIFYNNKYINTELIPIYFIDLARARPMTELERENLLDLIFKASGWQN